MPTTSALFAGSSLGAFLMRGAGCTWNDITDRDIDGSVARTRSRPIPSGQVSVKQALVWLVAQALLAFLILLSQYVSAHVLAEQDEEGQQRLRHQPDKRLFHADLSRRDRPRAVRATEPSISRSVMSFQVQPAPRIRKAPRLDPANSQRS